MLTAEDIKAYAHSGENANVEFKYCVPSKVRDLTEEVCSFANASGGFLLIGITDEGEIKGTTISNSSRSAIQSSFSEISPALPYEMYNVDVDGKEVWVVEVQAGKHKPYFYAGALYVREGANSQKITNVDEIRELFQHNDRIYFDALPMPKADMSKELDLENLLEFRQAANISPEVTTEQVLDNLRIFDESGAITSGGLLFFAKHPENYFFHAVVRCVMFKGVDKVYIIDDKTFSGPLLQQYNGATEWLKAKLQVSYSMEGTGPRKEVWEIPLEVFKEAIVNALAHRDYYEQGASVTIEMFDDRVEISNPGTLLPVVAKNFGKKSLSRNPLIFSLFTRAHLVEHIGSGIPRMRKLMLDAGLPEPKYDVDGMFTVTLQRHKEEKDKSLRIKPALTAQQSKILGYMRRQPDITIDELCERLHLGRTSMNKRIKELKAMGAVRRTGRKNGSGWIVNDN
ncbi:MAG: helix-turn-helix domain-containing protein [Prevotellaceae bacterium]|nr:helix-turn-helix domain-containing protein [Prevotellaceae bacterium]